MPSPIESPRRTPLKASLLLRQTPALTVFINNIIIPSQSDGSAPPFSNKNKTFIAWLFCFCSRFRRKRRQGGRSAPIRLNPPPAHKDDASRKITRNTGVQTMTCSDSLYPPPSPQSAPYPVRYTLVYIVTAVFYGNGFICYSPSRRIKAFLLYYCGKKIIKKDSCEQQKPYILFFTGRKVNTNSTCHYKRIGNDVDKRWEL